MDLREKKTKRSIKKAFLEIRGKKPLEKITVKELSELAEISKATFYLHYKDIYDLSEELSYEVIREIVNAFCSFLAPIFEGTFQLIIRCALSGT